MNLVLSNAANATISAQSNAVLTLTAAHSISGTITTGNNKALPGVSVTDGTQVVITDANGAYKISGLQDGSYTITPTLDFYTFNATSVTVTIASNSLTGENFTAAGIPVCGEFRLFADSRARQCRGELYLYRVRSNAADVPMEFRGRQQHQRPIRNGQPHL